MIADELGDLQGQSTYDIEGLCERQIVELIASGVLDRALPSNATRGSGNTVLDFTRTTASGANWLGWASIHARLKPSG
ncbi:hypothetical protein C2L64_23700 [Paraburkholderia hospita]|uniref:Uncharacterized protein n=1 Tax=Paraburkholderia hospita TaxID=169430 RepID=A0AAN1JCH3_9BURK|nr:hypothetical protein C2L64_23700 [Paraburkholderia hospita]OUL87380.1 hypothetical protein CA602_14070 [Paraburkholderia hospita]